MDKVAKIVAIVNQKGGVGKTTTCVNLAAALKYLGKRVLLCDFDPQANATSGMGVDKSVSNGVYDVLINGVETRKAIVTTPYGDVLPSSKALAGGGVEMIEMADRQFLLRSALDAVREDYDYIFVDCPPSLELLTLILVVAAFASIVANTFKATYVDGVLDKAASAANASTAIISIMFILMAIVFGFFVYRRNAPLGISTVIGVIGIAVCMYIGLKWHPIYLSGNVWMIIVGLYIAIASVTPVWILLQPRDYLSSFLLYAMMILAVVGIIGCHPTVDMPAFTGFKDTLAPSGTSLGYMFPALFVTIACGAVSGFHSLVGSGTTAKQLDQEKDAKPIAYGGMLIECALALISVCAVGYIWAQYADGTTVTPTVVFATGLASMFSKVFGAGCYNVVYSMLILAVSAFCLTSVDTATRLARYMFQEFFTAPGESRENMPGWKKVVTNPYVATAITVVAGVALGMTGYAKIWALFGAANQLLAALGLLAVCCWLGKIGRNNKMFYFPMFFMLIVTLTSLVFTIKAQFVGIAAGGEGVAWFYIRAIIAILLVVLAIVLVVEGIQALSRNKKAAAAK